VAILWHELWHEGLEEASRLYFGEHNAKGMIESLEPLHQMIDRGPQTSKEISFNQVRHSSLMRPGVVGTESASTGSTWAGFLSSMSRLSCRRGMEFMVVTPAFL